MMAPKAKRDAVQNAEKERRLKLERLQAQIDRIEAALEKSTLSASQRSVMTKRLDHLYAEKDAISGGPRTKRPGKEVYACAMGDYSGPKTPDGRCPKCGMTLQAQSKTKPQAKAAAAQDGVYVCPMGDYSGPKTPDGRCPKCGMDLLKK